MKTVLVVDDEPDLTEVISFPLEQLGLETLEAHSGVEGWEVFLSRENIDLVITDVRMPSGSGVELMEKIKAVKPSVPVILMSGFADITAEEAKRLGASALLQKPMELFQIEEWVQRLLEL